MNNAFRKILLLFFAVFIIGMHAGQASTSDHMCNHDHGLLCVNDEIKNIGDASRDINLINDQIEKYIVNKVRISGTFKEHLRYEIGHVSLQLPTLQYHQKFPGLTNIDQVKFFVVFGLFFLIILIFFRSTSSIFSKKPTTP